MLLVKHYLHTVLLHSWVCNKTSTIKKRFINSNTSILLCLISITILWSVAFFLSKGFEKYNYQYTNN